MTWWRIGWWMGSVVSAALGLRGGGSGVVLRRW
jgi:hypothetical protein